MFIDIVGTRKTGSDLKILHLRTVAESCALATFAFICVFLRLTLASQHHAVLVSEIVRNLLAIGSSERNVKDFVHVAVGGAAASSGLLPF